MKNCDIVGASMCIIYLMGDFFELVVIKAPSGHVCSYESIKLLHLVNNSREFLSGITYIDHYRSSSQSEKRHIFGDLARWQVL